MAISDPIDLGERQTLAEAAAQALIAYIAQNGLKEGDQLPSERQLVDMTGVSRLPLREALSMLKGLGIVETRQGKGAFVKPTDPAAVFSMLSPLLRVRADVDARHLFQVRSHLEASIAELAAARSAENGLTVLRAELAAMQATCRDDRRAFIEHDMAFHQELARSTGNPIFRILMACITDLLAEVHTQFRDDADYRARAVGEHAAILEAIEQGDAGRARAAMLAHLRHAETRL
jgi:GntR family transcriptional repressor for pyruvate dehydrogenase complex